MLSSSLKYNLLSFDELVISLDRLSRFKIPEDAYPRVFNSIILKCLISPGYSKKDLLLEDVNLISKIVKRIWNDSVKFHCGNCDENKTSNSALKFLVTNTFKNIDEKISVLINTDLNISPILKKVDYKSASLNLKFLINVNKNGNDITYKEIREKYSLCFPIEKLLIVEGITEEILLPVFADKLNMNFNKNGILVLGAGGKSKSPALYMSLKDRLKIPVVLLFDSDAQEICNELNNYLLKKDKYIMIESGEFEDILPINLIKRTLNNEYKPATPLSVEELRRFDKMCLNIETFYRNRHLGELKKAKLAKMLANNVKYETDISENVKKIINSVIL